VHEEWRQQLINVHIMTTRCSCRPVAATIACVYNDHRDDWGSVSRPIAAMIALCEQSSDLNVTDRY